MKDNGFRAALYFCTFIFSYFFVISCAKDEGDSRYNPNVIENIEEPKLISFSFSAAKNPETLIEDVNSEIIGDSVIECWIPYLISDKYLEADILCLGGAKLDGEIYSDGRKHDYSRPVALIISNDSLQKKYEVHVHSFTGLPVLYVDTEGRAEINSLDDYIPAKYKLVENVVTRGAGDTTEGNLEIRGRGNSTWYTPKKPYRLKFEKKVSLFGEASNKHWALLANYYDHTMLRNAIAFYMGAISTLAYTPKAHFVELILNGHYCGTYQLTETIRIDKERLNIGDNGFILEIDNHPRASEISFKTPRLVFPVRIHKPEVTPTDSDYVFIKNYFLQAEEALFSDSFLDSTNGYKRYFDVESFAEWYIITEILENPEAGDGYINMARGDKLNMGPLWDFDLALGNSFAADYGNKAFDWEFFFARNQQWNPYFKRLFEDPQFVELVKTRFNYYYSKKEEIFRFINESASYLKYSAIENDNRWGLLYKNLSGRPLSALSVWGSYYNEVQYIKDFLNHRFECLKIEIDKL